MAGNTIGKLFQVTTWGESHGKAVGVVIDGCPPQIPLDAQQIQLMLDRRRPGSSIASTQRKEEDIAEIFSGVFNGKTTGTPILIIVENTDAKPTAYRAYADIFRPGHGDYTYQAKYGIRDWRGGGRGSARETVGRVAAGAVAKEILNRHQIDVLNAFLCPDSDAAEAMHRHVGDIKKRGDSIGGIVEILASGVPVGLGAPVFDKLDADIAKALMSIGAVKGIEIGSGFQAARLLGSENNDAITPQGFATNNAGGILAGISNGDNVIIRVAVKPIPSISIEQDTIDSQSHPRTISVKGRHDISAIPRINVVCEAMVNIIIADHLLRQKAIQSKGGQ
jgi:chorismate synthase